MMGSDMRKRKKGSEERRMIKYELTHFDRVMLAILGFVGLVIFWKGLATLLDNSFFNSNPYLMIIAGFVVMFLTGRLISK